MKQPVVLILDPRGNIASGGVDVLNRHKLYGKALLNQASEFKLVIFTSGVGLQEQSLKGKYFDKYIVSFPTFNPLKFAWKSSELILKKNLEVKLLVTGDPWEGFWSAFILTKFLRNKIPIQSQIHADIADPLWRTLNLQNRLRYFFAKLSIPYSSSLRAVGKHQVKNLVENLKVSKSMVEIIPVPIFLKQRKNYKSKNNQRPRSIALIGRMHTDRGIWKFIELLEKLQPDVNEIIVFVVGDIDPKSQFYIKLNALVSKKYLKILGQVSQQSLNKYWEKFGVVASLAPVESYGRVMREALLSDVPVWAIKSSGVKDLMSQYKTGVNYINFDHSGNKLIADFEKLLRVKIDSSVNQKFEIQNNLLPSLLVKSWISLIKN